MAGYITCFQCAWLEASKLCGTHHHHVASSPCMAGSHRHSRSLCRSKDANSSCMWRRAGRWNSNPNFGMRRGIGAGARDANLGSGPGCEPLPL